MILSAIRTFSYLFGLGHVAVYSVGIYRYLGFLLSGILDYVSYWDSMYYLLE